MNRKSSTPTCLRVVGCALVLGVMAGGCASEPARQQPGFRIQNLAKSDIDFVVDASIKAQETLLGELLVKLYRRNPAELRKATDKTLPDRQQQLQQPGELIFDEVQGKLGTDAILLGLDPGYTGDRVFAVMVGLTDMIRRTYNYKREYFMLDELDQQKLYNSARNIEVLIWRLKQRQDAAGQPILLTNELQGGVENLSFERLFGKMIALQDLLAQITAEKTNRSINTVIQRAAAMVFLPI